MKECKCCFDWCNKEDFSLSIELHKLEFYGMCNECVEAQMPTYKSEDKRKFKMTRDQYRQPKRKEYFKERFPDYYADNKEKFYVASSKRRATKLERTLCGDYREEMEDIYKEARNLRESGEDVHVDHIVPLKGKNVSGLHVPWNLQIIPAEENLSKGNRFDTYVEVY